ncbi:MAG TPA: hypothetical protein VH391_05850 [Solirubrobacterales bacterium]|jgi:hypothetical protein
MARKPLRSQLNQIRAWVRQGRTDAWIAHQLDVPATELREFRRRHQLSPEEETGDVELRDEIEAEIEATLGEEEEDEEEELEEELEEDEEPAGEEADDEEAEGEADARGTGNGKAPTRRRRRRRGRRRGGGARAGASMQGTFDHGAEEGFGLWLDPAVEDDPVYTQHWAGHRPVEVTIEPDRIVIRRA